MLNGQNVESSYNWSKRVKKYHFKEKDVMFFKLLSYFDIIFRCLEENKTFMKSKSLALSFALSLLFCNTEGEQNRLI